MNEKNPIFRSLAMIEERIQEKLNVEVLAEGIHFSKYHYQRMFREAVGESVMGYVTRRRLALAAAELARTRCTILEIALRYGYDSHEGFTRSFKAHMGVTPAEYRKYHRFVVSVGAGKEKSNMLYSKTTDEIIREMNGLIVEARETAVYTRKHKSDMPEAAVFYDRFWEYVADRAEEMAEGLAEALEQVADIERRPDGISARFVIIKAIEDAAFLSSLTAFQTGLTIARALPEHREAFRQLCGRYEQLAVRARMKAGKIADFLRELAAMIFQDMRRNAAERLEETAAAGKAAAEKLSGPGLPYGYIAEEILEISGQLLAVPLEEVTVYGLEDLWFRLETVVFAARMDLLRAPSHRELFDGIADFKVCLSETLEFFRGLPEGAAAEFALCREQEAGAEIPVPEGEKVAAERASSEGRETPSRSLRKLYEDLAAQEGILLFYLKGEIQKLGEAHLDREQTAAFQDICGKLEQAVGLARSASGESAAGEIAGLLGEAYDGMTAQAERLGRYGGAISYIAEVVKGPLRHLPDCAG